MILSKTIEIKVNSVDISRFKDLNLNVKVGELVEIPIEFLSPNSGRKINVKCDICGKEKSLSLNKYNKNIKKHNIYACCGKCSRIKKELTNLEKYGVENYSQTEEYKNRYKSTCLEKYGVENTFQSEEIKNKIKETNLEKYGVDYPTKSKNVLDKRKNNNKEKYGVDSPSKLDSVKNKSKQTCLEKYGVEYAFQSEEIKNKIKETNLEKYGVEYSSQNENSRKKYKETCLEKYGVDNASKSDEIKNKKIQTSLKNYGVPYPSQNLLVYMKQQKSGFKMKFHEDMKLFYRGSYEKDFLDFCFLNKINISEGKRISYIFEKKSHYYFSDFYFEELNLIIEIKSHYTYNKYIKKNKAKKKYTLKYGYNYLIIFDKNYNQFINQTC